MKANETMCPECMGLTKKTFYWNGRQICEECYLKHVADELTAIADAKAMLAGRVERLQQETGYAINFGIDDAEEIYVDKGLEIIGKALQSEPFRRDYDFGGHRDTVVYGSTEFYSADLGV